MPSILIDQNIVTYGDILMPERINDVIGYVRKPLVGKDGDWLREEISCLPSISKLVNDNAITAYRYIELDLENWKRSGSADTSRLGQLFPNTIMHEVPPAIERSYFFQASLTEHLHNDQVIEFCKWLNKKNIEADILNILTNKPVPKEVIKNVNSLPNFHELCRVLQKEAQYVDAFHLWSAEMCNIDYFLTADRKFINAIKNANCSCQAILPSQLLEVLNINIREPFKYQHNVFYNICGQPMWNID